MLRGLVGLLRDRDVLTLWAGQALSDAGSELYRLGAIWLAVGLAGPDAAWLPIGCFLVRAGDRLVLVDAGLGPELRDYQGACIWSAGSFPGSA